MAEDRSRNPFEAFKVEIDPDRIDESVRALTDRLAQLVEQGRHVKVRLKYRGRPLMKDIPLSVVAAAQIAGFWYAGIMQALVVNLGVKALLEVEFIHEADELVIEGQQRFGEGEVEAAEALYREALRMKPGDAAAHYNLGVLCRVTGRRDEAVANFEKAAAVPGHPDAARAADALDRLRRGDKRA